MDFSHSEDLLQGLVGLDKADDPGNGAQNPGFLATGNGSRRRGFGKETAVTGAAGMGFECAQLSIKTKDGPGNQGLLLEKQESFTRKRVGKLSLPSRIKS